MKIEYVNDIPNWSEVRVKWRDAHCPSSGWHDTSDYEPKDAVATTVGRIWHGCQEHYITLVGTIFESELPDPECVGDINHIPEAWIVDVQVISIQEETRGTHYEG